MKNYAADTDADRELEGEDSDFKPLTSEEAQEWRTRNPQMSVWRFVVVQAEVGVLVALVAWLVTGRAEVGWSAAYGADRKSTRLNSSHLAISYAVFCLQKKMAKRRSDEFTAAAECRRFALKQ